MTVPPTVSPPAWDVVPTMRVAAVMAARSVAATEKVPPAAPTEIDLAPFGISDTVPLPAAMLPEKVTSLAVIVTAELVVEMDVEPALVTLPVPSVVIVTPVVPVAFAFKATVPLLPDDVLNTNELPERALDAVRLPFVVMVRAPLLEVIAPVVVKLADAPVVVSENVPPAVDAPTDTAPELVTKAVPGLPVLIVKLVLALVCMGTYVVPMSPVVDNNATVVPVMVESPVRIMSPVPFAETVLAVAPPILVPIVISALLPVESVVAPPVKLMVPPPVKIRACPDVGETV